MISSGWEEGGLTSCAMCLQLLNVEFVIFYTHSNLLHVCLHIVVFPV